MSEVSVEISAGVAQIVLAAPSRRNALTEDMALQLIAACSSIDSDERVGAVVLKATGPSFCAGADRSLLVAAAEGSSEAAQAVALVYESFVRVSGLAAPSIAAVRGHAIGAGFNLALATDLRIAAVDAQFGSGFMSLGFHPGGGHFSALARRAGAETASGMALFSQMIDGGRAHRIGLVWEAIRADDVEPRALELATALGADPELARLAAKTMRQELGPPPLSWAHAMEMERTSQLWSLRRDRTRMQLANAVARRPK